MLRGWWFKNGRWTSGLEFGRKFEFIGSLGL